MANVIRQRVFKNTYRDSVESMRVAAEVERLPGIARAGIVMATAANLGVLAEAGLLAAPTVEARPSDLLAAVCADSEAAGDAALEWAAAALAGSTQPRTDDRRVQPVTTLHDALAEMPDANLVLVSTPGAYATAEALKALKRGLHVFLFSDNVPLSDEIALKDLAERKGLLMMGPDCGTAMLDGIPLGFANVVRRGRIGLIGASGTGLQQVSCLIDRLGEGVSQMIGVGGRDLDERVGGRMTLAALRRLSGDDGTAVIVLISKPPAPAVAERVLAAARDCPKPVVVNFLGWAGAPGFASALTFEDAALNAVALARGGSADGLVRGGHEQPAAAEGLRFASGQRGIRGLFCGGSLAGEAKLVLRGALGDGYAGRVTVIDLGDDEYTVGRPHPMIDPRLRNQHIVAAARDPAVAVILLDVVLGYNAHPDPAGALVPAVEEARREARRGGRELAVVASICGTPDDPQDLRRQHATLVAAGVALASSNAGAARLAARIATEAGAATPVDRAGPSHGGGLS
ncbi:MAG TPA: acyl-CoA synthetase FdrA [bacterium]|nr:acyl-CoA synthetase FdrA [bacterium]